MSDMLPEAVPHRKQTAVRVVHPSNLKTSTKCSVRTLKPLCQMASSSAKRPRLGERTLLACQLCKHKKLKCDAQIPKCQNCLSKGGDCLVEDPATGLLRPRDYMRSLETRVAYLEELLRQSRPDVADDHLPTSPIPRDSQLQFLNATITTGVPNVLGQASSPQSPDITRVITNEGNHEGSDLASEVALLALGAAGREPQYFGPSSALSFAQVAGASFALQRRHGVDAGDDELATCAKTPQMERCMELPPPHKAQRLVEAYFKNVHPQYPILHRPTFENWQAQCVHANQLGNLETAPGISLFFVLMLYAIGSLIVDNGDQSNAETYYLTSLEHIAQIIDMDRLESVQALLMCAVYSIRSPEGASIWKLSGMAIRHCIELGYHRSSRRFRPNTDSLTAEMSKRAFWVAYDIDRAAAFTLGRPFGIPDEMIDAELPSDVDDSTITSSRVHLHSLENAAAGPLSGAIHIIKLRRIWSRISDSIYSPSIKVGENTCLSVSASIVGLRQELDLWHDAIPVQADAPDKGPITVFATRDWFRLAYCHSILLLYRHYLTCTSSSHHTDQSPYRCTQDIIDNAALQCAAHSREICTLYRQTYQRSPVRYTWGSLHILFLGGLTYLHCLWTSKAVRGSLRQLDVINTCTACTMVLVIIAERWAKAKIYRDIFEQLSEQTIAFICGDGETSKNAFAPLAHHHQLGGDHVNTQGQVGLGEAQIDDWILNLGNVNVDESNPWFVQDLIRGFADQPDSMPFMNFGAY